MTTTRTSKRLVAGGLATRLAVVLTLLLTTGCAVVAGATASGVVIGTVVGRAVDGRTAAGGPRTRGAVAITLDPPRDITIAGRLGQAAWLRGASFLAGRVTEERGDTLLIALSEARWADGRSTYSIGGETTASIVRGPDLAVRIINRNPARIEGAFVGALAGAAAAFLTILVICTSTRCLD